MKIVIIGGGIVGASACYHLAKAGHDVTLIDDERAGQATRHAAGIISPWLSKRRSKTWYQLAKMSAWYYPILHRELLEKEQLESGYKQVGALYIHKEKHVLADLEKRALERRQMAPEMGKIIWLNEEEVKAKFPIIAPRYEAIFVSGGGRVSGSVLVSTLKLAAIKNGAKWLNGTARLAKKGQTLSVYHLQQSIPFEKIIHAGGAWMRESLQEISYDLEVFPQKGQIIEAKLPMKKTNDWPVILPPSAKSIVPFDEGKLMLGATHEKTAGFDLTPTNAGEKEIIQAVQPFLATELRDLPKRLAVGTRPYTSDFIPMIGQLANEPIFVANGLGASGLTTGAYVGKILADLVMEGEIMIPLQNYDPNHYLYKK
ncbi:FAD-binding oxidoreductase [Listeria sp. PSOL-1]|uniref:NAD(P)/FAD-dependent oxidoreductase n=1 Tax=Listeria sp. PSOL-1 TaxID=1844999 RepID=UPI0013D70E40|nr:FAD-dependent oxidoreductase [Listeria sp. PSOL-1]